jgi:hypothetical protein
MKTPIHSMDVRAVMKDPVQEIVDAFNSAVKNEYCTATECILKVPSGLTVRLKARLLKTFKEAGYTCKYVEDMTSMEFQWKVYLPTDRVLFRCNLRMAMIERCGVDVARHFF